MKTVKKKFFPDEATLQACVEAGKEYAKLVNKYKNYLKSII
ncbi:MAG: hypothetical protein ACLUEA_04885 [Romboutsia timonensis]